ncbi:MAG TPA: YadA-like family protein [Fontimonas sp.]
MYTRSVGRTAVSAFRFNAIAAAVKDSQQARLEVPMTWASKAFVAAAAVGALTQPAFATPGDAHPCVESTGGDLSTVCGDPAAGNVAGGASNIAIGSKNVTLGSPGNNYGDTAVGVNNVIRSGSAGQSTAIGVRNSLHGTSSHVHGDNNTVGGFQTDVDGNFVLDGNGNKIPLGSTTVTTAVGFTTVIGSRNTAWHNTGAQSYMSVVGAENEVSGLRSSALGYNNTIGAFSVGKDGTSYTPTGWANDATALGSGNTVNNANSSAVGVNNVIGATGNGQSVAMGFNNKIADVVDGGQAVVIGSTNTVGVSLGGDDKINGLRTTVIGYKNVAPGEQSVILGYNNNTGDGTVAGSGEAALAIGNNNTSTGLRSIAIGTGDETSVGATVTAQDAIAIGSGNATAAGARSIAFGNAASVGAGINDAVALGAGSVATEAFTVSIGSGAGLNPTRRIVNVTAGLNDTDGVNVSQLKGVATAIGGGAQINPVTGAFEFVDPAGIDIGGTKYTTIAEAIEAAAAGGGLCAINGNGTGLQCSVDGTAAANGANGVAIGSNNTIGSKSSNSTVIGTKNAIIYSGTLDAPGFVGGYNNTLEFTGTATQAGIVLGSGNNVTASNGLAVAVGTANTLAGAGVMFGSGNALNGVGGVVVGSRNQASNNVSAAIGSGSTASGKFALALGTGLLEGTGATAAATDSIAIGRLSNAGQTSSVAIGTGASSTAANAVAIGSNSVADVANTVSVGKAGAERNIVNVRAGVNDTDAVNVSQLKGVTDLIGGGVVVDPVTGAVSTTINVGGDTYNSLTEAIEGVSDSAVQYDAGSDKNVITLQGKDGATLITKLAEGAVNATSSDAINGSQLYGVSESIVTSVLGGGTVNGDGSITGPTYIIGGNNQTTIVDAFNAVDTEIGDINTKIGGLLQDALLFKGGAYDANRAGNPTKIIGVADGTVAAGSNDAVNGGQLFAVQQQVDTNTTDIGNLTTQVNNIDGRVTTVEGEIVNLDNRVTTVEGNVNNLTTTVNQHTTQINNLDNRVTKNTTDIANLDNRVTNVDNRVTAIDNRVTNVEGDIVDLSQQITSVGGSAEAAQQTANQAVAAAGAAQGTADEALNMAQDNAAFCGRGRGANSIRCGTNADVEIEASDGIAIGTDAQALAEGGIAMGAGATAVQSNSVAIGAGARAQSSVAVGTGAQATGTNTTALGDNAVASGATAVAVGNNAVASGDNSVALGNGSVATQANTVSVGSETQQRRITNVAPGVDPTDAVNLSQLNQYQDETNYRIYQQGRLLNSVGAMSAAMAMAIPDPRVKGDDQIAVGFGNYRDSQSVAASYSQLVNDNFALRVGGAYATGGESMVGAGFTIGW